VPLRERNGAEITRTGLMHVEVLERVNRLVDIHLDIALTCRTY
jgi:hypothetical protein